MKNNEWESECEELLAAIDFIFDGVNKKKIAVVMCKMLAAHLADCDDPQKTFKQLQGMLQVALSMELKGKQGTNK